MSGIFFGDFPTLFVCACVCMALAMASYYMIDKQFSFQIHSTLTSTVCAIRFTIEEAIEHGMNGEFTLSLFLAIFNCLLTNEHTHICVEGTHKNLN